MSTDSSTPDQRATILAAAVTVLQRDGASGLTVRNVAKEAGCSTTGVYTYFGGKSGLVEALYLEGFESFERTLSETYESGDFRSAGRAYRRWALENRTHYLVMFGNAVPDYEPSPGAVEQAGRSFASLVDALRQAVPWVGDDAQRWAYHVSATVHGYVMLELVNMHGYDPDHHAELYEAGLTRMFSSRPVRS